jgi:tellurite resistance protein
MAESARLGRDVFIALAAVGWADGQLTPEGADAIVRTALDEGLDLDEIRAIEEATKTRVDVGVVDKMAMSKADRLYVYAVASWIASLDGAVTAKEEEALGKLGAALGVPEAPRRHADEIMRQIALEGDRPMRFDLPRLRATLAERLDAAHKARLEQYANPKSSEN